MTDVTSHANGSGAFGADTATRYTQRPHGFDGLRVLDQQLTAGIQTHVKHGSIWADPGGGSGWLSLKMAKLGARVLYSDRSEAFFSTARAAVLAEQLDDLIDLKIADVTSLATHYEPQSVDGVLLSNVGCAVQTLGIMMQNCAALLKPGGILIATAPATLEQVFTTDVDENQAVAEFEEALRGVKTIDELRTLVSQQTKFHRATLRFIGGVASLVRDLQLPDGTDIWRLISGEKPLMVPNFWHSDREYRWAIQQAGLVLAKDGVYEETLDQDQRTGWNTGRPLRETLGVRYERNPAFRIYTAQKPI